MKRIVVVLLFVMVLFQPVEWLNADDQAVVSAVAAKVTLESISASPPEARIVEHRLEVQGTPQFQFIAIPVIDWNAHKDMELLPQLKKKGFTAVQMNLYWTHFAQDQDGKTVYTLGVLPQYIKQARDLDLQVIVGFVTTGIANGADPLFLHERYGVEAYRAVDIDGNRLDRDTEYDLDHPVVSIHHRDFQREAREFIAYILQMLPTEQLLWIETPSQPQYLGTDWIDFGPAAQSAFRAWLPTKFDTVEALNQRWETSLASFDQVQVPTRSGTPNEGNAWIQWWDYLEFRTDELINWVNGDIAVIQEHAPGLPVAVDVIFTEWGMEKRLGDATRFVQEVQADIFQCHRPAGWVYSTIRPVLQRPDQALMDHWTASATMAKENPYDPELTADQVLRRRLVDGLLNGNRVGWSFVGTTAGTDDPIALYNDDWSAKPAIAFMEAAPKTPTTPFFKKITDHYVQQPMPARGELAIVFDHSSAFGRYHPQFDPQGLRYPAQLEALTGLMNEIGRGYKNIDIIPFDKEYLAKYKHWIIVGADVADDETIEWLDVNLPTHFYLRFGLPGQLRVDGTLRDRDKLEAMWTRQEGDDEIFLGDIVPPGLVSADEDVVVTLKNLDGPRGVIAEVGYALVGVWAAACHQYFGDKYYTAPYQGDDYLIYNEDPGVDSIIIGARELAAIGN